MQTFLPLMTFSESASVLDNKSLGKQRVEAWQLLKAIREGGAWANHPATKMWAAHQGGLIVYGWYICKEWISRGFKDTMLERFQAELNTIDPFCEIYPPWLTEEFCSSHRANLLRKNPKWYGKFGWTESPREGYDWPKV